MTITLSADINSIELFNIAELTREFIAHCMKSRANAFWLTALQNNKMPGYPCRRMNIKGSQKKTMNVHILLNAFKAVPNKLIVPLFITELKHPRVVNHGAGL